MRTGTENIRHSTAFSSTLTGFTSGDNSTPSDGSDGSGDLGDVGEVGDRGDVGDVGDRGDMSSPLRRLRMPSLESGRARRCADGCGESTSALPSTCGSSTSCPSLRTAAPRISAPQIIPTKRRRRKTRGVVAYSVARDSSSAGCSDATTVNVTANAAASVP